jgi:hypothetical protein
VSKVVDVTCMFCGQAPCVCNKRKPRAKVKPVATSAPVTPVEEAKPVPAPVPQRRLSAVDRMRAGTTASAGRAVMPAKPTARATVEEPTGTPVAPRTDAHSPSVPSHDPVFDVAIANLMPLLGPEYRGMERDNVQYRSDLWRKKVSKE